MFKRFKKWKNKKNNNDNKEEENSFSDITPTLNTRKSLNNDDNDDNFNEKKNEEKKSNLNNNKKIIFHDGPILSINHIKDSNLLITGGNDGTIRITDYIDENELYIYENAHNNAINDITIFKNSENFENIQFFSCSRDLTIKKWDLNNQNDCLHIYNGHELNISSIDLNNLTYNKNNKNLLASGSRDTFLNIWDINENKKITRCKKSRNLITCLKWRPMSENEIIQGSEDLHLYHWDVRTFSINKLNTLNNYIYFPLSLDISNNGNYILTSSKGFNSVGCEVKLWDLRMNSIIYDMNGHEQDTISCKFFNNIDDNEQPNLCITASKDQTIRLWDLNNGICKDIYDSPFHSQWTALEIIDHNNLIFTASSFGGQLGIFKIENDEIIIEKILNHF